MSATSKQARARARRSRSWPSGSAAKRAASGSPWSASSSPSCSSSAPASSSTGSATPRTTSRPAAAARRRSASRSARTTRPHEVVDLRGLPLPVLRRARAGRPTRSWRALADDGKVAGEYRPFVLLSQVGDYSERTAAAFGVVLDQAGPDVAKEFHDLLFANQPSEAGPFPERRRPRRPRGPGGRRRGRGRGRHPRPRRQGLRRRRDGGRRRGRRPVARRRSWSTARCSPTAGPSTSSPRT